MCIDTEWPDSLKNEFTSCMSVKWSPRQMKWEIRVPEILFMTRDRYIKLKSPRKCPARKGGTPVNLRDKQFLLHFFYEWMGYVLHGVQWNWPPSMDSDFDRWWHRENRDISVGVEMMGGNVEIACHKQSWKKFWKKKTPQSRSIKSIKKNNCACLEAGLVW